MSFDIDIIIVYVLQALVEGVGPLFFAILFNIFKEVHVGGWRAPDGAPYLAGSLFILGALNIASAIPTTPPAAAGHAQQQQQSAA